MELETVIQNRRSIRKFTDRPVEKYKLLSILESARLCQSAKNRKPWRFLLLEVEKKDTAAAIMPSLFKQRENTPLGYLNSSQNTAGVLRNAPILLLVSTNRTRNGSSMTCSPSALLWNISVCRRSIWV